MLVNVAMNCVFISFTSYAAFITSIKPSTQQRRFG